MTAPAAVRAALAAVVAAVVAAFAVAAAAQPAAQSDAPSAQPAQQTPMSDGEVRRVDRSAGKVTLKHGEIVHLGMTPMTMVFQVRNPELLAGLKPGDRVRFRAEQSGSIFYVTAVEPAR